MAGAARYVVGIDLGTTHTVVAYAAIDPKAQRKSAPEPRIFEVPQLTASRELEPMAMLPSCLYAPVPGEVERDPTWVSGELARRRGAEVTSRFVASAKSWLSHAAVDRLAAILPWGSNDDANAPKISPVDASALFLTHIREAWDRDLPDAPLAEQDVVLTLPASFDEVARELTLRAAQQAGLAPFLLEEPTAAFYAAMRGERAIRDLVGEGAQLGEKERTVLVCDVGGGTTDLSLMGIAKASAPPWFAVRRIAVGRHILLGGDNMDLALAHLAEPRIVGSGCARLAPAELAQLVLSCREAKERILGASAADEARVVVLGRGSRLVGGARGTTLKRDEVERAVLGGFFPEVGPDAPPDRKRGAIVSFGLPYERDPAITRHVRQFLARHAAEMPRGVPDALLLNGGVFNAKPIVEALVTAITGMAGEAEPPSVLPGTDPDLAVARGAVLYGFARRGVGIRIESGASHGYYVAVAPEAGIDAIRAVCILPRGAKEGVRYEAGRTFELVVGRSVRFDVYASDVQRDETGTLVTIPHTIPEAQEDGAFERLPPVVAKLPASGKEGSVPVHLGGELQTTGQLELACTEARSGEGEKRKYRLEFQLREGAAARATSMPPPPSLVPPRSMPPDGAHASSVRISVAPSKLMDAERILDHVFGKKNEADPRATKDVVRDLEKVLGDRATWTMEVTRALADRLLTNTGSRRRTEHHERNYWLLLGYCMRPGFGDPGDVARVERAWPTFEGRLAFPDEPRGWQQFFIAWRRMSGGMTEAMQLGVRDAFDAVIAPPDAKLKKPKRTPEAPDELLATLAALERVPIARRTQLGEWISERTWGPASSRGGPAGSDDPRLWSAIGRVGARVPVYASVHHVVPPKVAEAWIERLLRLDWKTIATAPHAAVQLARVTGDRARDVNAKLREDVAKRLAAVNAKEAWIKAVRELVEVGEEERVAMLGEGLPIGLRLLEK